MLQVQSWLQASNGTGILNAILAPLYLRHVPNIAEFSARRYQVPVLKSLVWRDLGLNPGILDHWRTLYPLVFTKSPGNRGSIPGLVISKTKKIVLDASLLSTQHLRYGSRIKWSNPGKRVAPFPTPRWSSYWKREPSAPSSVTVANFTYITCLLKFRIKSNQPMKTSTQKN